MTTESEDMMSATGAEPDRDASATERPVTVGRRYTFHSTLQGIDANGIYPCLYTGRRCTVLALVGADENETDERMYRVRFEDGAETGAWEGEIDGFHLRAGTFHGPFAVEVRPGDEPASFEINDRATTEEVSR